MILRVCFGMYGERFIGKVLASKLRAKSWNETTGTLSIVLENEHKQTFCLELSKQEVCGILFHYQPGYILNHFEGDKTKAEAWLQTSKRIIENPSNRQERIPKTRKPENPRSFLRIGSHDPQTSSRILQNFLWLKSALRDEILTLKAKKISKKV